MDETVLRTHYFKLFDRLTKGLLTKTYIKDVGNFYVAVQNHFLCQPLSWKPSYHHQIRPQASSQRGACCPLESGDCQHTVAIVGR